MRETISLLAFFIFLGSQAFAAVVETPILNCVGPAALDAPSFNVVSRSVSAVDRSPAYFLKVAPMTHNEQVTEYPLNVFADDYSSELHFYAAGQSESYYASIYVNGDKQKSHIKLNSSDIHQRNFSVTDYICTFEAIAVPYNPVH